MQLRVEDGRADLAHPQGPGLDREVRRHRRGRRRPARRILDGEVVALDAAGQPDFAGLQAALSDGDTGDLIFFAFDLLFANGEDLRDLPLRERKARLKALMGPDEPRLRFVDHFETAGDAVLLSACKLELEGIISKRLDAPYRSGRSDTWTKSKCRAGHEVVIGGYTTTGSAFRSLIAGVYRDGKLAHVGRIGTGFGRDKVAKLLPRLKALETDKSPFEGKGAPRKAAEHPLGEAAAGGRDRICRLHRRRLDPPGLVQGPARGQAGRRGRGRGSAPAEDRRAGRTRRPRRPRPQAQVRDHRHRQGGQRRAGRDDLQARQAAVARRRGRAGHQDRPGPLHGGGRRVDAAAHQGPAGLDHPGAGRDRRRDLLPAPRHARDVVADRTGQRAGDRSPTSSSTGSRP
jgi:DNA ligase D-like protein (predicted ligase)